MPHALLFAWASSRALAQPLLAADLAADSVHAGPLPPTRPAQTFTIALSLAEICSALPTSGGVYFWSGVLAGKHGPVFSWVAGWLQVLGQVGGARWAGGGHSARRGALAAAQAGTSPAASFVLSSRAATCGTRVRGRCDCARLRRAGWRGRSSLLRCLPDRPLSAGHTWLGRRWA